MEGDWSDLRLAARSLLSLLCPFFFVPGESCCTAGGRELWAI